MSEEEVSALSVEDFKESLTAQKVMTAQIIVFALISGVVIFLGVAFFIQGDNELVLLSEDGYLFAIITAAMTVGALGASFALSRATVLMTGTTRVSGNPVYNDTPADKAFGKILTSYILRFAPLEGAALMGCVFFFIGQGYLHLLAIVPLLVVGFFAFPTRQRIIDTFILRIKKDPRLQHTAL